MRTLAAAFLAAACILAAGCAGPPAPAPPTAAPAPDAQRVAELTALAAAPVLVLETDMGTIRAILYTHRMPATAARIADLAGSGFYDGTLIHRVADDFVIQGGDPTGTGEGGSGQLIPFEADPDLTFGVGALGMAQWTPGTADSQWFITEKPAPHLNAGTDDPVASRLGPYPLFGQVVAGMDVVRAISEVPVIPELDRPIEDVPVRTAVVGDATGVDLLSLPRALVATAELSGGLFHVDQPRFAYATHAFAIDVVVAQAPPSPQTIEMVFRRADGPDVAVPLEAIDDGTVFRGGVLLTAGEWEQVLRVGGQEAAWPVRVLSWHADYVAFTGST